MRNTNGAAYAASKYIEIPVREESTLLDFLLKQMGISRNRAKDLLSGKAITVDRKLVTRHDGKDSIIKKIGRRKICIALNHYGYPLQLDINIQYLKLQHASRYCHLNNLTLLLAQQRLRNWSADSELALTQVCLIL